MGFFSSKKSVMLEECVRFIKSTEEERGEYLEAKKKLFKFLSCVALINNIN